MKVQTASTAKPLPPPPPLPALGPMSVSFQGSAGSPCGRPGRPHRVLCYGDSLTVGFCAEGRQYEPYGRALAEALGAAGVPGCEVSVCGHSGHTAAEMVANLDAAAIEDVGGMVGKGLRRILEEEHCLPDLVLLMAGTNDLGQSTAPRQILGNVCRLHAVCHAHGVRTVALAPPPSPRMPPGTPWEQNRRHLTGLLAAWARSGRGAGLATFAEPGEMVPGSAGGRWWDPDGLHLSPLGSQLLGQRLAQFIAPLLHMAPTKSLSTPQFRVLPGTSPPMVVPGARQGNHRAAVAPVAAAGGSLS